MQLDPERLYKLIEVRARKAKLIGRAELNTEEDKSKKTRKKAINHSTVFSNLADSEEDMAFETFTGLCHGCGCCETVCPSRIPLARFIYRKSLYNYSLREDAKSAAKEDGAPVKTETSPAGQDAPEQEPAAHAEREKHTAESAGEQSAVSEGAGEGQAIEKGTENGS